MSNTQATQSPFTPLDAMLHNIVETCRQRQLPVTLDGHLLKFPDRKFAIAAVSFGVFAVDPVPDETPLGDDVVGIDGYAGMHRFTVAWSEPPKYRLQHPDDSTLELFDRYGLMVARALRAAGGDRWVIRRQGAPLTETVAGELATRGRLHEIGEAWTAGDPS